MHEMLGNQYFLIRNYIEAEKEFEVGLLSDPDNFKIKKKLIVCYIQTGHVDSALTLFHNIVSTDPKIITDTNPEEDNCPCPEIIYELESILNNSEVELKTLSLAMLWLYCDLEESIWYFEQYYQFNKSTHIIKSILASLNKEINK